jgi:hypothetical protein
MDFLGIPVFLGKSLIQPSSQLYDSLHSRKLRIIEVEKKYLTMKKPLFWLGYSLFRVVLLPKAPIQPMRN